MRQRAKQLTEAWNRALPSVRAEVEWAEEAGTSYLRAINAQAVSLQQPTNSAAQEQAQELAGVFNNFAGRLPTDLLRQICNNQSVVGKDRLD